MKSLKMLSEITLKEAGEIIGGAAADCTCNCNCHCSCYCIDDDVKSSKKDAEVEWKCASVLADVQAGKGD